MMERTRSARRASCSAVALLLFAAPLTAQTERSSGVELTPQVGFGGHVGEGPSSQAGSAGIELGYGQSTRSFVFRAEILGLSQSCHDGLLSGGCRYPSAGLLGFSIGVRQRFPVSDRFVPYAGAAGGLYLWTEGSADPGASFDLGFAVPTRTRVSLELGARWRTVWRDGSISVLTGQFGTRIAL